MAASIFIRNLHPNVTQSKLYQTFSSIGPLLSLHICLEPTTKRPLGYAYVNFVDQIHANRAIETMNFKLLEGRPIQIVGSERDPLLRKIKRPNVFVKNLDRSVTNRELYLAFAQFGTVLSSTVATDRNGISKGYGFVQFEDDDSVKRSISMLNSLMVKNKILFVQRFVEQKGNGVVKQNSANIYVKHIPKDLTDQGLREMFEKFGEIVSPKIMTDSDGSSRCFGFVSFESEEAALRAIFQMNGHILPNGEILCVCRAQTKKEREIAMKKVQSGLEMTNLCVTNLDDTVDDDRLRKEFQPYGTVITAKVIMKQERSIGIGYVCFSKQTDAEIAIAAVNGRTIGTKPMIVYLSNGLRSSSADKHLLNGNSSRPNWLDIVDSTVQADADEMEKRKPDMATVYRMLSPPDVSEISFIQSV